VSTLFWSAFAAMAGLLLLRWIVPQKAPDSRFAHWLTKRVSFELDDPIEDEQPVES